MNLIEKYLGESNSLPYDIQAAVKRRNIDFINGKLSLPSGDPVSKNNAKIILKRAKNRIIDNTKILNKLKKLPDNASIEEIRRNLWNDSRITSKKGAISMIKSMIADSEQYIKDIENAIKFVEKKK
jgi:hypothetical protein